MNNPWLRVPRPYAGGELVCMSHSVTGKNTLMLNVMGEVSYPMINAAIARLAMEMSNEIETLKDLRTSKALEQLTH